jgi:hypothetical protein
MLLGVMMLQAMMNVDVASDFEQIEEILHYSQIVIDEADALDRGCRA